MYSDNNQIMDNIISNHSLEGINIWTGSGNMISSNIFSDNEEGIYLCSSGNTVSSNSFYRDGIIIFSSPNTVVNNTVNGKPLLYLESRSNIVIDEQVGQVILANCNNIIVQHQNISFTSCGIELFQTNNCFLTQNTFYKNGVGVFIYSGRKNRIENCVFMGNGDGIDALGENVGNEVVGNKFYENTVGMWFGGERSLISGNVFINHNTSIDAGIDRSTIENNFIQNSTKYGIKIHTSSNNLIEENMIINSGYGIYLTGKYSGSDKNKIIENNLEENEYGLYLFFGEYNFIHNNNFIDNQLQAYDRCSGVVGCNQWDNGMDGNYWSDFDESSEGAYDNNSDGIVDKPYHILGGNMGDRYPLINPWGKEIKIEIYGGLGVKIIFKNVGKESLSNLEWSIELKGLVFFGRINNGIIPLLNPNESYELKIFFFGLGKGKIKVTAGDSFKTDNLVILGPFAFINYSPKLVNFGRVE